MKNEPLVTVIIPAYNVQRYIKKCVNSVLNQNYKNFELIVVNDGSKDNTLAILRRYAHEDNRVKVIDKRNGGVSSARNVGLQHSKGQYITFIDGDDYVAKDYLEYLLELISYKDADFALSTNVFSKRKDRQINHDVKRVLTSEQATALLMSTRIVVGSWNKIYKRKFLQNNNLRFDEKLYYGEGLSFITSVAERANKTIIGQRRIYYYRKNNAASATTKFEVTRILNGIESIAKIKNNLIIDSPKIDQMIKLHLAVYYLGAVVNLINSGNTRKYKNYYQKWLKFVRKNTFCLIKDSNVSYYRKLMLITGSISPYLIAKLDKIRRNKIYKDSID